MIQNCQRLGEWELDIGYFIPLTCRSNWRKLYRKYSPSSASAGLGEGKNGGQEDGGSTLVQEKRELERGEWQRHKSEWWW